MTKLKQWQMTALKEDFQLVESDLYLSNISPLGVPFNNLRGNTKDNEKISMADKGKPGSPCTKKHLAISNKEFSKIPLCTASRKYQYLKIKELDKENLSSNEYHKKYNEIVDKACLCTGLGSSVLLVNNLDTKTEGDAVSVCPGPNMAYFSKKMTLKEIIDHIYGRINVLESNNRPNFFIKELNIYIEFLRNKIDEFSISIPKQKQYLLNFIENLKTGINYYINLFSNQQDNFRFIKSDRLSTLDIKKEDIDSIKTEIKILMQKLIRSY